MRLGAERGAKLAWLPQETIVFDRAKVARKLDVDVAAEASITICEAVIFGRAAMGERVATGYFSDRWRIRRGGRLIFADTLKLAGEVDPILALRAVAHGASAVATIVQVAPDAEAKVDRVRTISLPEVEFGVSAFNGLIIVRALARNGFELRRLILAILENLETPVPRAFTL